MEPLQPRYPWRGYVNQLTYGVSLHSRVDDAVVARIADQLIDQWFFTLPVASYYEAAAAALESEARIVYDEQEENEEVVRDFLARILHALDERRPWPEPSFVELDPSEWPAFRSAPAIGHIPLSQLDVRKRLNRVFYEVPPDGGEPAEVLVLRLRTGQIVALLAPALVTEPGINLLAHTDPASTVAAFRELTGIDVGPL